MEFILAAHPNRLVCLFKVCKGLCTLSHFFFFLVWNCCTSKKSPIKILGPSEAFRELSHQESEKICGSGTQPRQDRGPGHTESFHNSDSSLSIGQIVIFRGMIIKKRRTVHTMWRTEREDSSAPSCNLRCQMKDSGVSQIGNSSGERQRKKCVF